MGTLTFVIAFIFAANKSSFYNFRVQRKTAVNILACFLSGQNLAAALPTTAGSEELFLCHVSDSFLCCYGRVEESRMEERLNDHHKGDEKV